MTELMKHKKDLRIPKISKDEAINVYTFLLVVPGMFGRKRTTKSDIAYLTTSGRWRDKSFQIDLGCY